MARLVKRLLGNREVIFDKGRFDDWCVYLIDTNGRKRAPLDKEYFKDLQKISQNYPNDKIYNDFVKIYNKTTRNIDLKVLTLIDEIVKSYQAEDQWLVEQWFAVIYAGMIAEENKSKAVLKKRIKRLGMYQVLILNMDPMQAAGFSIGQKWRQLDIIMQNFGF